jgi:hypothetical protein
MKTTTLLQIIDSLEYEESIDACQESIKLNHKKLPEVFWRHSTKKIT